MGCVKITLLATYAFNVIMSLSRASTRGSYSRIEGVTPAPTHRITVEFYLLNHARIIKSRKLSMSILSSVAGARPKAWGILDSVFLYGMELFIDPQDKCENSIKVLGATAHCG